MTAINAGTNTTSESAPSAPAYSHASLGWFIQWRNRLKAPMLTRKTAALKASLRRVFKLCLLPMTEDHRGSDARRKLKIAASRTVGGRSYNTYKDSRSWIKDAENRKLLREAGTH
jgi:hypothetical protein